MKTNNFDELKDKVNASRYLGKKLQEGTLTLFLGAGTSHGLGLPNWVELVNALRLGTGLDLLTSSSTADDLQRGADEARSIIGTDIDLIVKIEKILYAKFIDLSLNEVMSNKLLIALSALLMGSKRGHVRKVVTLNYDNMLEWFLSLFGFVVKTVHTLPSLEGSEDVIIYHPHGFVPRSGSASRSSNFIILGMKEVNRRLGTQGDPWFERVRHLLDTGLCLFLGMSARTLSDRALAPLFTVCGEKCANERPLGIWILKDKLEHSQEVEFFQYNIIPLSIDNEVDIVEFLFTICQNATIY